MHDFVVEHLGGGLEFFGDDFAVEFAENGVGVRDVDDGVLCDELSDVPGIVVGLECVLEFVVGESDGTAFEVGGDHGVFDECVGHTDDHIVFVGGVTFAVDADLCFSFGAEENECEVDEVGVFVGRDFAEVFEDDDFVVGVDGVDVLSDGLEADVFDFAVVVHG